METSNTESLAQTFEKNRYAVLRKAVEPNLCEFLCDYFSLLKIKGWTNTKDPQVPGTHVMYAADAFETLLGRLSGPLSTATGIELYPTYTYARIYKAGDDLKPHRDRKSCEISATLHLGGESDANWPIFIKDKEGRDVEVQLEPGDLMIYRGSELLHWRTAFEGEWWAQVFLHYVDSQGEYKHRKFDTRPYLGYPLNSRRDPE